LRSNLAIVPRLQPTDLSYPTLIDLFKPKVCYQTHQKWLKMLTKPDQHAPLSITKSGNLNTTALAIGFYYLFVSNGIKI